MEPPSDEPSRAGLTVWLTGLPAAGKTTIADGLAVALRARSHLVQVLDGDRLRSTVNADLDFSLGARKEAARRAGELAVTLAQDGNVVVVAMVSPTAEDRAAVRQHHRNHGLCFVEVWVSTPLDVCEERDPKGLYKSARRGEIDNMTGIDSAYEPPSAPEVVIPTQDMSRNDAVLLLLGAIEPRLQPREVFCTRPSS